MDVKKNYFTKQVMKQAVQRLLKVSPFRFAAIFLIVAVIFSVMIVLTVDFLWDGRFNLELEFAGVITPFIDGLFLSVFVIAMLDEIREEVVRRRTAEDEVRKLNEGLEQMVEERTKQLLEAREELVRNEKLIVLGQLAGSVGHELRNPLGVMNNAIYYLKTVLPESDETVREYLNMIKSEIDNSERIISDLLDFSRTKTPQMKLTAVSELMSKSLGKCLVPENVKIETNISDTLPLLNLDPFQMTQVFQNLIANACEAMPKGGDLLIKARLAHAGLVPAPGRERQPQESPLQKANDFIEISVRDTGEGISPENMKNIFQPLFTTKVKGIGLGLTVVKNLVEANGGRIEVESELGKGTTFTVLLLLKQQTMTSPETGDNNESI